MNVPSSLASAPNPARQFAPASLQAFQSLLPDEQEAIEFKRLLNQSIGLGCAVFDRFLGRRTEDNNNQASEKSVGADECQNFESATPGNVPIEDDKIRPVETKISNGGIAILRGYQSALRGLSIERQPDEVKISWVVLYDQDRQRARSSEHGRRWQLMVRQLSGEPRLK